MALPVILIHVIKQACSRNSQRGLGLDEFVKGVESYKNMLLSSKNEENLKEMDTFHKGGFTATGLRTKSTEYSWHFSAISMCYED
jgi:hypothetical protein